MYVHIHVHAQRHHNKIDATLAPYIIHIKMYYYVTCKTGTTIDSRLSKHWTRQPHWGHCSRTGRAGSRHQSRGRGSAPDSMTWEYQWRETRWRWAWRLNKNNTLDTFVVNQTPKITKQEILRILKIGVRIFHLIQHGSYLRFRTS